ncbi:hypothetical protein TNCV_4601741 [Trichonephila clavipes]|nr:hypothetical protein TNCV_4601741 [Trichonephila clavipes]
MKIILSDEKPIAQRSRSLSLPEKREVENQIDEWLEQGIIIESCFDFSSPVVVCKKKDGTVRLCIDYRRLNKKIIKDIYPLPIIKEVLDKLGNGKIFTTLDLKNAFFHVDVHEASRKYIAFVAETFQYEFLNVPFGLSISSNYFQKYIDYVFRELLRDGKLIIYLDDIIIPATDEKEANKKAARLLETDENVRNIKNLLPSNKTTEFILNDNDLFKISEKLELLVVSEMMQVNVIKKVHSFRHFAVTKTEELIGQQEDAIGEWENLPPKTEKKQKKEIIIRKESW